MKKWSLLGLSKMDGGLGFRDFEAFNKALLAKQCWRLLHNPQAFWAQILRRIYFSNGDFLTAQKGGHASWCWSSLLNGRAVILEGARTQILSCNSTLIWSDLWLLHDSLGHPRSYLPIPPSAPRLVSEIIDWDEHKWDLSRINIFLDKATKEKILATPFWAPNVDDHLIWASSKSGVYTVRSGYHWCMQKVRRPLGKLPHFSKHHPKNLEGYLVDQYASQDQTLSVERCV